MRPWMVWLLVLACLALLAAAKVGVHVSYLEKKLRLDLLVSKFRFTILGGEAKKPKRQKKRQAPKEKTQKPKAEKAPKAQKEGKPDLKPWLQAAQTYWRELLELVGRVLTSPTLDVLKLQILVGGKDAEACAMTYGRICAVVGCVLPVVENTFGIRKRQIDVRCCFDRENLDISAEAAITIRIYEIFALAFALLGLGLKLLLAAKNNKKAVQNS